MNRLKFIVMLGMAICISACMGMTELEDPEDHILKKEVVIKAVHELDPRTRTVLQENGDVWWKPGDAISVFFGSYGSTFHAYNTEDAPVAYFIGEMYMPQADTDFSYGSPGVPTYWGVFPSNISNQYTEDDGFDYSSGNKDYEFPARDGESVNVYLPARQKGVAGTFDNNNFISIARSSDYKELSFYNLCGGLAFCVEKEGIHTVTFSGNAGETLAGKVNVVMNSEGRPVVNKVLNGKTEVTLAMKKGEYFIPGEWYYIVMLPTVLSQGYSMEFRTDTQNGTFVSSEAVDIRRSVFGKLTSPDSSAEWIKAVIVEIDGEFSDWDAVDQQRLSEAVCASGARKTALKTLKACADAEWLHVYFEFDPEQITDRGYVPIEIFINADNSSNTGGYNDSYWRYAYVDYMFEGAIFEDGQFCSYDARIYPWAGEIGGSGWIWDDAYYHLDGFSKGAGSENKYELSIDRLELERSGICMADGFSLGMTILQNWESVGVLPNSDVTEHNPSGISPTLKVWPYASGNGTFDKDTPDEYYSVDDIYMMFKYPFEFDYRSVQNYIDNYLCMSELRGDNVAQSILTTHKTYEFNSYTDDSETLSSSMFWHTSYAIIHACNQNIELMTVGESLETDHIIGECYFLRALCHLNLVNLYATPYSRGPEKLGVIVRTSTDLSSTVRSTVGQVYDQIVSDLNKAARLMKNGKRRGDAGYVSYDAARGLLSRVYLYMGRYQECVSISEGMMGGSPEAHLDDITTYFANTRNSKETLWCVSISPDDDYINKGYVGSMYHYDGWGEMFWSDPLMELMLRHPEDKRLANLEIRGKTDDGRKMVHWPMISEDGGHRDIDVVLDVDFDKDAASNTIRHTTGVTYNVKRIIGDAGYPEYYIENLYPEISDDNDGFLGPKQTKVYVRDNVLRSQGLKWNNYPMYAMSKFSIQEGRPTYLASPAMIRWAEVILNTAEAYACLGDEMNALKYVNIIRSRAGVPIWSDRSAFMLEGYKDILDVVLDERRLELCFEGHRAIDLYRNSMNIDRRFSGVHPWEIMDISVLDHMFPYCIPAYVMEETGIPGNGRN